MAMAITALLADAGTAIDYDQGFRAVLEDHMTYLRKHPKTTMIMIQPGDAYKYEFDLFGLLTLYGVKRSMQWVTMRMNDYTTPMQATVELESLIVPSETVINQIRQTHQTSHKLS